MSALDIAVLDDRLRRVERPVEMRRAIGWFGYLLAIFPVDIDAAVVMHALDPPRNLGQASLISAQDIRRRVRVAVVQDQASRRMFCDATFPQPSTRCPSFKGMSAQSVYWVQM
eukprot:629672-Rhodomonas_salina.2